MILSYHHIVPKIEIVKAKKLDPKDGWSFTVSSEGFDSHLSILLKKGFKLKTLGEYIGNIKRNGKENFRDVVLTFDDGWIDNYRYAFPILKKHAVPACFFITTSELYSTEDDKKRMSIKEIRDLSDSGMEIGSHTIHHKDLTKLSLNVAKKEICESKAIIEEAIDKDVHFFAYPGGALNQLIVDLVKETGYKAACSALGTGYNNNSSLFWLYRTVLTETMDTFKDRLRLSLIYSKLNTLRVKKALNRNLFNS